MWRQPQTIVDDGPIHRTSADEGPACGTALLGGVAAGIYRDVGEACARIELPEEMAFPQPESVTANNGYCEVYHSLYATNKSAMHRLSRVVAGG